MHEATPDDRPPRRIASWGTLEIADRCGRVGGCAGEGGGRGGEFWGQCECVCVGGRGGRRRACADLQPSPAWLGPNTLLLRPPPPRSVSEFPAAYRVSGSTHDSEERLSVSSGASGSGASSGVTPDPSVLAQLDCCDPSASLSLWDSLLPLAANVMLTEGGGSEGGGDGLDFIAP